MSSLRQLRKAVRIRDERKRQPVFLRIEGERGDVHHAHVRFNPAEQFLHSTCTRRGTIRTPGGVKEPRAPPPPATGAGADSSTPTDTSFISLNRTIASIVAIKSDTPASSGNAVASFARSSEVMEANRSSIAITFSRLASRCARRSCSSSTEIAEAARKEANAGRRTNHPASASATALPAITNASACEDAEGCASDRAGGWGADEW